MSTIPLQGMSLAACVRKGRSRKDPATLKLGAYRMHQDMLNADLHLKNEAAPKGKGKRQNLDTEDEESGFHFIAFMPIGTKLWKLDGLERQPMCLGTR